MEENGYTIYELLEAVMADESWEPDEETRQSLAGYLMYCL